MKDWNKAKEVASGGFKVHIKWRTKEAMKAKWNSTTSSQHTDIKIRCVLPVIPSDKQLLIDPHERTCVVGFALVLNAVEAVPPLAVVPLVVVVVLHLPHRLKHPHLCELKRKTHECKGEHTVFGGDQQRREWEMRKLFRSYFSHPILSCIKACADEMKTDGNMHTQIHSHPPRAPGLWIGQMGRVDAPRHTHTNIHVKPGELIFVVTLPTLCFSCTIFLYRLKKTSYKCGLEL